MSKSEQPFNSSANFLAKSGYSCPYDIVLICPIHEGHFRTMYFPLSYINLAATPVFHLYPHLLHSQLTFVFEVTDNSSELILVLALKS